MAHNRQLSFRSMATLGAMLLLAALLIMQVVSPDVTLTAEAVLNLSFLAPCLAVSFVIYLSVLFDHTWYGEGKVFRVLIVVEFFLLFAAAMFWIVKCRPVSDLELALVYYAEDILFSTMIVSFAIYQSTVYRSTRDLADKLDKAILAVYLVAVLVYFINPTTGLIFSVVDGKHIQGPLFLLQIVPNIIMVILILVSALKFAQTGRMKVLMISCILVPFTILSVGFPTTITASYVSILVMLTFIYNGVYVDRGLKIVKAEALVVEQKATMMMSSIEPRFLDQSLESIMEMEGTPEEAREALGLFKSYLDTNFETLSKKLPIPITSELKHVGVYTKLEKLRFKDKLDVVFDIRDRDFEVPSMTVQMLVENAVKHGITQRKSGGKVVISTYETAESHFVVVKDDGVGFDIHAPRSTDRSHVGLENLEVRLRELVGGSFKIESTPGEGTVATVSIPKH